MTAASSIDRKEDVEVSGPERNSGLSEVGANPTQTEEGGKPEHNHVAIYPSPSPTLLCLPLCLHPFPTQNPTSVRSICQFAVFFYKKKLVLRYV